MDTFITQQYTQRQANEFQRIFKRNIREFWDGSLLGFNIIKFNDDVVKSGTQQMRAAIRQTWGIEGSQLIAELVGAPRE